MTWPPLRPRAAADERPHQRTKVAERVFDLLAWA